MRVIDFIIRTTKEEWNIQIFVFKKKNEYKYELCMGINGSTIDKKGKAQKIETIGDEILKWIGESEEYTFEKVIDPKVGSYFNFNNDMKREPETDRIIINGSIKKLPDNWTKEEFDLFWKREFNNKIQKILKMYYN